MLAQQEGAPPSGPVEKAVATIEAVKAGQRGKYRGRFRYRVRLHNGTEGEITISEAFAPGTRLRVLYTPAQRPHLWVHAYERCDGVCSLEGQSIR
jgi:hypothetical protein